MTMVPAHQQSLSKQHPYGGYASYSEGFGGYDCCSESDLVIGPMAEDDSRTTESVNEAGSLSKDEREGSGWLQLGIGGRTGNHDNKLDQADDQTAPRPGLIELDLLPGRSSSTSSQHMRSLPSPLPPAFQVPEFRAPRSVSNSYGSSSLFLQNPGTSSMFASHYHHHLHPQQQHQQQINWAFRPIPRNITIASSSSSSSPSLIPSGSFLARPFQLHAGGLDVPGPSLDFRIIDPPRRPHSGLWFMLQASQNQAKEPFLPQIPKSYLRIKDGRMTVRLLMKYLVNKLRLDSESEIEITCRGQQLLPFLTLQHVRDTIWSPREAALTLLPDSTTDHLMVIHYARSSN